MGRPLSDDERERRRQLWRGHTVKEIAEITGKSCRAIQAYGSRHFGGMLGHSEAVRQRIRAVQNANLKLSFIPEVRTKCKAAVRELHRKERLRDKYGLPPKTKWRRAQMPQKAYQARYGLVRFYNYYYFDDDPYTLYYDKDTRRCQKSHNRYNTGEEYYVKKYGFRFKEGESYGL